MTAHAFGDDVLQDHDGVTLAALIRDNEVRPDEVVAAAAARARRVEPSINAVVVEDYDAAVERSRAHVDGAFGGVPTFIKDQDDVVGLPTRYGSEALENVGPATHTSEPIAQMFDMGMVCLGKSSLPEFGFVPSTEFPNSEATRNPWNPGHTAGGSSGGSAALVASGVVPIAHAADGGGSIRVPAACCGLVGLKPSRGRLVTAADAPKMPVNVVVDGVVTRTVRDTALYFAEAEKRYHNPQLRPIGAVEQPLTRSLRVGVTTESPGRGTVDAPTRRVFEETVELLTAQGHHVEPISLPVGEQFAADFELYWSLFAFAVALAGKRFVDPTFERDRLSDLTKGLSRSFKKNIVRAPGAIYRLRKSDEGYARIFDELDLVMTPTLGQVPPPIGHLGMDLPYDTLFPRVKDWVLYTPYANATGAPSISLSLGHDDATNLPIGMMFGARYGDERLLLELALQLEEARPRRTIN